MKSNKNCYRMLLHPIRSQIFYSVRKTRFWTLVIESSNFAGCAYDANCDQIEADHVTTAEYFSAVS